VLKNLHPADLAAVATYSIERGPKLVVTFTPDRAQLARGIDTLGLNQETELRRDALRFMIEPPASNAGLGPGIAMGEGTQGSRGPAAELRAQTDQALREHLQVLSLAADKSERSFEANRISGVTRALADMAKSLNIVRGRKHVVYFSEGLNSNLVFGRSDLNDQAAETEIQDAMFGRLDRVDNDTRFGNTALQGDMHRMLEEFKRADCVIQAVDIGGLRASTDASGRATMRGQEALFYMANETGGELFKDANNLGQPLERMLERTSLTYVLTFERSDLKLDGAYHRLRVKVKDLPAGSRVSYRTGYYAPRPFNEMNPLEKNLLAAGAIASPEPRRDVEVNLLAAAFRATETLSYVPVILEIGGLSLLSGMEGSKLNVEIYAYVSDHEGQMRDFFNQRVALDLSKDQGRKSMQDGGIKYYGHFELPAGAYHVRVLVRNADTGRTGVQRAEIEVPAYHQAEPVLLPPFFMEDRRKWLLVRESGEGQQGSVVYPFTVEGEPYVPAVRPVLRRESPARLCLVAYNLGKGDLAVQGKVLAADGKTSPAGRLSKVERTPTGIQGLDKLVATFDPAGMNAGDYVLQVAVTDPATGRKEMNSLPFQVLQ
jgi:VWFA-related protein